MLQHEVISSEQTSFIIGITQHNHLVCLDKYMVISLLFCQVPTAALSSERHNSYQLQIRRRALRERTSSAASMSEPKAIPQIHWYFPSLVSKRNGLSEPFSHLIFLFGCNIPMPCKGYGSLLYRKSLFHCLFTL